MSYFIISSFINALACGFCCLFVLVINHKSKVAKSFALFNSTVALWSFFYFLSMLATRYEEALFYSRILNVIACFIPPVFLNFCAKITDCKKGWVKNLIFIFLVIDVLMIPFIPTNYFIQGMEHKLIFPFWPTPGILFHFSIIQFSVLVPISLSLIRNKFLNSSGDIQKIYKILYYTFIITFLGGSTNYFLCYNIPIMPYGNALVAFFTITFFFLILRYQIMDINIVLSRSFVYTILISLISLFYFTSTYFTEIYVKEIIGYKSYLFSILCAFITALAFIPLKDWLQKVIDKLFFKKSINEIEQENKLLKQEVTQTERLKSVAILASGMAHEIKNPLTVLKTFAEFLPKKLDDKEFLRKFQPMILNEIDRIDRMVHELLDFAKPAPLQAKLTVIHTLLDQTLEFLSNDFLKHKINISKDYGLESNLVLSLDQNQIKQALLNILLNAIEAMPNGGSITIITRPSVDQQNILIKIQDTGYGIKTQDITHIFDPFFTKKDHGTGLGLSITHEIIKNHQGRIFVESEEGKGTTFIIELPYNLTLR